MTHMTFKSDLFDQIWVIDFEFHGGPGELVTPVCMVARELLSGLLMRVWQDDLLKMKDPPFDISQRSLIVAFYAVAECSCFLVLGWPLPKNILDLYTEFRNETNGIVPRKNTGLIKALRYYGLNSIGTLEKLTMRDLVLTGGPWSEEEQGQILDYCQSDVEALPLLLEKLYPTINLPQALIRGQYMAATAQMEHHGIPIDTETLNLLKTHWEDIKSTLIENVDEQYHIYENGSFRLERFKNWLTQNNIPWPHLESGQPDLKTDTFKKMSHIYPEVLPLKELRTALSQLRLNKLSVGADARNRCMLSPFGTVTGRNTPSNTRFIFGPAVWFRALIKPEPYIDYEKQEFAIAAALSGDRNMIDAYRTGDPYLSFGKQAGALPPHATKETHEAERELFKAVTLGVNYGMGRETLAFSIKRSVLKAHNLIEQHKATYKQFWKWSNNVRNFANLYGYLITNYGWKFHTGNNPNPRMLGNFPIQGNGAEILRLAVILAFRRGVKVIGPVHDAILIQSDLKSLDDAIQTAQEAMVEASEIVLNGFKITTEAKKFCYPNRYTDNRGVPMWNRVMGILNNV